MKFSAKKSIFQNCLSGSPFGLVLLGNFEKSIFWPKISLKNDRIEVVGPKFLNALQLAFILVVSQRSVDSNQKFSNVVPKNDGEFFFNH